ncbi:MAG TPA: DUF2171 domain-containing protein [Solirubrobacteraceae bacterium]|nr:DUF2171 domain-containing protein [Solirubrobacteraceae bacterium]
MSARVAWLSIKSGWKVLAADGSEIGEVDEVVGDEHSDIFDGLSIATSALGEPRYVTADRVAEIEEGTVRLALGPEEVAQLEEYLQPATSVEIEPDDHRGVVEKIEAEFRKVEGEIVEPTQRHEHPFNLATRISHFVRRLRGR